MKREGEGSKLYGEIKCKKAAIVTKREYLAFSKREFFDRF